jgi:hypothetical protein
VKMKLNGRVRVPIPRTKKKVSIWTPVHTKSMEDVKPIIETIKTFDIHSIFWLSQEIISEKRKRTARDEIAKKSMTAYSKWITNMRGGGGWSRDVSCNVSRVVSRQASPEQEEEQEEEELDFAEYELTQEDTEMEEADE